MMKKSLLLFILWAVAEVILTCINIILTRFDPLTGWILWFCAIALTLAMMSLIRTTAKAEQVTWLAVVSKVIFIINAVFGGLGVIFFLLSKLFGLYNYVNCSW
jgi:hypothetical protein